MRVVINGEEKQMTEGVTISAMLADEGEPADHVVVEINGAYCSPRQYETTSIAEGDLIEIILPAFGG